MKKMIASVLALTLAASAFAGCANTAATSSTAPASAAAPASSAAAPASSAAASTETPKADWPKKPVTITVPVSAGGGTDLLTRALAEPLKNALGQNVTVTNKTGAGGAIGFAAGASDKADGYSVTALVAELLTVPQVSQVNFTYQNFKPVCNVNSAYGTITVRADAPYNTLEEFITYAKEHPGEVKVGNSGVGGIWHFVAAAFASKTGIEVNHVPFEGGGSAVTALAGGHVDAVPVTAQEVDVQVKAGKAKLLCVLAPERLPELPDVPTAKELGFDGLEFNIFRGFGVPADTPDDVVAVLAEAFKTAMEDPAVTKFMEEQHFAKVYMTGDEFSAMMERDEAVYAQQATDLGLKKQ